jgi:drug/metabolite transporter (DMT)-like permease
MVYLLTSISVIGMTVAQLLLKKGMLLVGQFPPNLTEIIPFFAKAYTNTYVIGAVLVTILTALAWILAISKVDLSFLYPFMALSYVLVALFSFLFFKEGVTALRWAGIVTICLGVFLVSRS